MDTNPVRKYTALYSFMAYEGSFYFQENTQLRSCIFKLLKAEKALYQGPALGICVLSCEK